MYCLQSVLFVHQLHDCGATVRFNVIQKYVLGKFFFQRIARVQYFKLICTCMQASQCGIRFVHKMTVGVFAVLQKEKCIEKFFKNSSQEAQGPQYSYRKPPHVVQIHIVHTLTPGLRAQSCLEVQCFTQGYKLYTYVGKFFENLSKNHTGRICQVHSEWEKTSAQVNELTHSFSS